MSNTTKPSVEIVREAASRSARGGQDVSVATTMPGQPARLPMHESMRAPARALPGEERASSLQVIFIQHLNALPQAEHVAVRTWASARIVTLRGVGEAVALRMQDAAIREAMDTPGATQFVGSVTFCMDGMTATCVRQPRPMDYPDALKSSGLVADWPHIEPWGTVVGKMLGDAAGQDDEPIAGWPFQDEQGWIDSQRGAGLHVKPWLTKFPRGHWTPDTPVWITPWVDFDAEFRVYMLQGRVVGVARYDDGDFERGDLETRARENAILLHERWADDRNQGQRAPAGYAIDIGYQRASDAFRLVEVNDGWALGLYKGVSPWLYVELLSARWRELALQQWPDEH